MKTKIMSLLLGLIGLVGLSVIKAQYPPTTNMMFRVTGNTGGQLRSSFYVSKIDLITDIGQTFNLFTWNQPDDRGTQPDATTVWPGVKVPTAAKSFQLVFTSAFNNKTWNSCVFNFADLGQQQPYVIDFSGGNIMAGPIAPATESYSYFTVNGKTSSYCP